MKEAYWGYSIILLGLFVLTVMLLLQNRTTTSEHDEYLLREAVDASLFEAVDYAHYRRYGELRIVKEKFVENFLRRFSETVNINKTYRVDFYDIYEAPPKASVKVTTSTGTYSIMGDIGDYGIVDRIDSILEIELEEE